MYTKASFQHVTIMRLGLEHISARVEYVSLGSAVRVCVCGRECVCTFEYVMTWWSKKLIFPSVHLLYTLAPSHTPISIPII